jgi:hypothetical protein
MKLSFIYGRLQHASLKTSVYMLADAHPTEKTTIMRAGSLLLGNQPDEAALMTMLAMLTVSSKSSCLSVAANVH